MSGIFQLLAGLSVAVIPNFFIYCGFLFLYGMFGSGGAYVTGFVLSKLTHIQKASVYKLIKYINNACNISQQWNSWGRKAERRVGLCLVQLSLWELWLWHSGGT